MPEITTSDGVRLNYLESGDPRGRPGAARRRVQGPGDELEAAARPRSRRRATASSRSTAADTARSEIGPDGGHTMDRHGADIGDAIRRSGWRMRPWSGSRWAATRSGRCCSAGGATGIRDVVIVDQTPKMLNSDDWPYGFYGYDASNADTLLRRPASRIRAGTRVGLEGPGARRAAAARRLDLKAAKAGFTPAELELLNDHAKRDWRPAIAASPVPALFVAGRESEFWPCEHAAAAASLTPNGHVGRHREGRPRDQHRAAEGVQRGAARLAVPAPRLESPDRAPASEAPCRG